MLQRAESAQPKTPPTRDELAAWIRTLPEKDKDALLVDTALNAASESGEILRRFDLSQMGSHPTEVQAKRRTVGGLLAAAREIGAKKARLAAERQAAQRARQEREAANARALISTSWPRTNKEFGRRSSYSFRPSSRASMTSL